MVEALCRRRRHCGSRRARTREIGSFSDQCHRFLVIPTRHCANLSAAVYTVLYDRHAKRVQDGLELPHSTAGDFDEPDHMADAVGVTWGG
jgi:hypothetical protein